MSTENCLACNIHTLWIINTMKLAGGRKGDEGWARGPSGLEEVFWEPLVKGEGRSLNET